MLPNFVIIGAQKSASTYLQVCLADHPDIFLPAGETPFFQSPDYEESDISDLKRPFLNKPEKCLGIKRPNYIGRPEVPKRIEMHLPQAKIIAVLRNPIDRAISAYFHNIRYGFLPPLNVEIGMRKIINQPAFADKFPCAPEIIEYGYYYKYLSRYAYFLRIKQTLIFLHEDILAKPLDCIQEAYKFLGVSSSFTPPSLKSRPQKTLYNLTRLKFVSRSNRFFYDYDKEQTRLFVKSGNLVGKTIGRTVVAIDKRVLSLFLSNNAPQISPELRQSLYALYADDMNLLEGLIGRDLSAWRA